MRGIKHIATFCLLAAAFVLLGHDVIPHHHHYKSFLMNHQCRAELHNHNCASSDIDISDEKMEEEAQLKHDHDCNGCHFHTQRIYKPQKDISILLTYTILKSVFTSEEVSKEHYLIEDEDIPDQHLYNQIGLRAPPIS